MRLAMVFIFFQLFTIQVHADFSYRDSTRLKLQTPQLIDLGKGESSSLDKYKVIDLSASVEVGSSCGEMNVATNLQSNLKDLLSDDFFKGVGNTIQNAGGMLALCYLSPSYCSIAKHLRLSSHFLSQLNLDSCALVDKYVDNRISDYEITRQQCVRQAMQQNGGNVKAALEKCGQSGVELADWSGGKNGKVGSNALIESTAKWAGLKGEDATRIIDLTKSFVGDTVLARGGVGVEFGSRKKLTSPREFVELEGKLVEEKLAEIVYDVSQSDTSEWNLNSRMRTRIEETVGSNIPPDVAYEVVRKLSFMPIRARESAIRQLAKAVASNRVALDAEKSLEVLSLAARNPNLPPHRQQEAIALREQLKDSVEMTLELRKSEKTKLAEVISSIHQEGEKFESGVSRRNMEGDASRLNDQRLKQMFFDCSDPVFCEGGS